MESKKNLLIVGNTPTVSAFIKKIRNYDNVGKIYTTGRFAELTGTEIVDIREDSVEELLKFSFENEINLTTVFSQKAINVDIAGVFSANGQLIFAPEYSCAKYFIDKSALKKVLYKLGIKIPKFAVFDKLQTALEYLKTAKLPLIISPVTLKSDRDLYACPTISTANIAVNDLFFRGEEKILSDEYISGHNFTTYLITDGVSTLPVITVANGKFSDEVEGGFYTTGSWACVPDNKVTNDIENYIIYEVWEKISSYFGNAGNSYSGIVGINGVLTGNDEVYITDITAGINPADAQVLLNSVDDNLISLFEACAIGSFTDDYDFIKTDDGARISVSLFSHSEDKEILGLENMTEFENYALATKVFKGKYFTQKGFIGTVMAEARTLKSAKSKLKDDLKALDLNNFKYRKDILTEVDY